MSDPFVGEIRQVGFPFAPLGWALCNGQLMQIRQNTALFSILGTNYGGDGLATFGLPNLQGRFPLGAGQGPGLSSYSLGEVGGAATVTLTQSTMPAHSHAPGGSTDAGTADSPEGAVWAEPRTGRSKDRVYAAGGAPTPMATNLLAPSGGSAPHNNLSPFVVTNFIIALTGVFPPRP